MKKILVFILVASVIYQISSPAFAYEPYLNYTFSKKNFTAQEEPQAYLPAKIINGKALGTKDLNNPEDICVDSDGLIYVSDSGNDRILILDKDFKLVRTIKDFDNNGIMDSLKNPNGVFIAPDRSIYVADTDNSRIVVFDQELKLKSVFGKPVSNLIVNSDFNYKPIKIAVDFAYRMFIVSKNENNGMMELASDGSFTGYFGAIKTPTKIMDLFNFTQAQEDRKTKNMPLEYSNVNIDNAGFVYGTVSSYNANGSVNENIFVQRLNPTGIDVLKRNGFFSIMGDINYPYENGTPVLPQICDVTVRESGIYSILGKRSGRVYTYDDNGNLMYVFGGIGTNYGQFSSPVSLTVVDVDKYLVLDRNLNQILLFEPTRYGSLITDTAMDYYNMEYEKAEQKYAEILKYTAKSDTAYDGMGRSLYRKKDYVSAMRYFYLSGDRKGYSDSFKYYRAQWIDTYFNQIVGSILGIIILIFAMKRFMKNRKKSDKQLLPIKKFEKKDKKKEDAND